MAAPAPAKTSAPGLSGELPPEHLYYGPSESMRTVRRKVDRAAGLNVPILVLGESGTGKEVLARYIHALSPWRNGAFIKVNCAAIPGTLLESELFGYEKGAFTGANLSKPGRIEAARGGTLFLDEIAELDASLQAKLLHVLQDGVFTRIGDSEEKHMGARVICATNRDLSGDLESGAFRSDLFYRINVISVQLPPLRDRREDVPQLAEYFRQRLNQRFQRDAAPLSDAAIRLLQEKDWRGNVRELENTIARYVVLGSEDELFAERPDRTVSKPSFTTPAGASIPLKHITQQATRKMEHEVILKVLQANRWNRRKTAEALKISYRALLYKVRRAGLPAKRPPQKSEPALPLSSGTATVAD
ncbi:MAG: sigma 54-interacting transcriptional regulator [Candidatus Acidiferrales bacterium]